MSIEITNIRDLQDWLSDQPREICLTIAYRSAFRALPFWLREVLDHDQSSGSKLSELPIIRPIIIGMAATIEPTDKLSLLSETAHQAAFQATSGAYSDDSPAAMASDAAAYPAGAVYGVAFRNMAAEAANYAHMACELFDPTGILTGQYWKSVEFDCNATGKNYDLRTFPLWRDRDPLDALWQPWKAARPLGNPLWKFLVDLYQSVLNGSEFNSKILMDIALIPNEVWNSGPDAVAETIAEIELDHAIVATPNGEAVEVNSATGRLRLVPVSDLTDDIGDYARRKMTKAADLFDGAAGNQYAALAPDLAMIRSAVSDAGNFPVELFDTCASASRRLTLRIHNGECPSTETDALIADYLTRIRDAGADILSHDPKTQEAITARNAIAGNQALIDRAEAIRETVTRIVPATEGLLTTALPHDTAIATDPKADADDRKEASIRLSSRLLRIGKVVGIAGAGTTAAIVGTKEALEAIPAISDLLASPFYQQAWQAVLRYLGY